MHVAQKCARFWENDMHQNKDACRPKVRGGFGRDEHAPKLRLKTRRLNPALRKRAAKLLNFVLGFS
ncbi:MAG: hypothetical protein E5X74_11040 [Mesorhizobium sp.]|nr:MAG: hypothetical protein EOR75_06400 [Mesorhizobium sp.]TIO77777.1 MAG: hypothetical protein E5X75_08790 [Mesorhizobium sp.]TIO85631.1 MAG: hypothetical protein E5X74_11040 [Mesorhizobium sp.]